MLATAIIIESLTPGPKNVLEAYVDFVESDDEGGRFPTEIDQVRKAVRAVREVDGFSDFRMEHGSLYDDPHKKAPSLYSALMLGFSHLEIAKLFDMHFAGVAAVLLAEE